MLIPPSILRHPSRWLALYLLLLGIACLWPYNFFQENRVSVRNGAIRFSNPGTAFTRSPVSLPQGGGPFSLLLRYTCRRPMENAWITHWGESMGRYTILVGQFSNQILVDLSAGPDRRRSRVFVQGQVRPDTAVWLGVVYDGALLEVYFDGSRKGAAAVHVAAEGSPATAYPLVLGSHANGKFPWNGELEAFALFGRALTPEELSRPEALLREGDPLLRYDFAAATGGIVPDGGSAPAPTALVIPARFRPATLSPFVPPQNYWQRGPLYRDIIANVVLFLPFGVLLAALLHGRRRPGTIVVMVLLISGAVSAAIELLQAILPTRWSSLTDLVTNTAGGALGALAFVRGWLRPFADRIGVAGSPTTRPKTPVP